MHVFLRIWGCRVLFFCVFLINRLTDRFFFRMTRSLAITATANHDDGKCLRCYSENFSDRNPHAPNFIDPMAKFRILSANAAANGENHVLYLSPQRRLNLNRMLSRTENYV